MDDGVEVVTSDDPGYTLDFNLPGDTQGETNGMYAGVTQNHLDEYGYSYLAANPGTRTDYLATFRDILSGARGVISDVGSIQRERARQNAATAYAQRVGYQPSLGEQWNALSIFEKMGFALAVAGLFYAISRK